MVLEGLAKLVSPCELFVLPRALFGSCIYYITLIFFLIHQYASLRDEEPQEFAYTDMEDMLFRVELDPGRPQVVEGHLQFSGVVDRPSALNDDVIGIYLNISPDLRAEDLIDQPSDGGSRVAEVEGHSEVAKGAKKSYKCRLRHVLRIHDDLS